MGSYNNWQIIHCIDIIKWHEETNTYINFNIRHNAISNIALKIGKDIIDDNNGEISKIDKNAENGYYLVKW